VDAWSELKAVEATPGATYQLACAVARERRGSPGQWLVVAELATDPEAALEAVDRAIERDPRSVDAWDLRAELLVGAARLEEAWSSCQPEVFGDQAPARLRARQAWVFAEGGDLKHAIATVREVLADEPNYPWAWLQLADWNRAIGDAEGYLEATEEMVRVAPEHPMSWAYLGQARELTDDAAGADAAYERALAVAPDLDAVLEALVDLRVREDRLDAAEAALAAHGGGMPPAVIAALNVRVAAARVDSEAVLHHLEELLEAPEPVDDQLADAAFQAVYEVGLKGALVALLDARLRSAPTPAAAVWWVRLSSDRVRWAPLLSRIEGLLEYREAARAALIELLSAAAAKRKRRIIHAIRRRFGEVCQDDVVLWGQMGYALNAVDDRGATVRWLGDWRERQGVQGWMLANLAFSLRVLKAPESAAEVADRSVDLPPYDGIDARRAWSALDHAVLGEVELARERLRQTDSLALDPMDEFAFDLAWAVCVMTPGVAEGHEDPLATARERIARAKHRSPGWERSRDLVTAHNGAVRAIARHLGWLRGLLWRVRNLQLRAQ
jgi:tetratricopeptide (TPR) repeat protein